MRKGGENRYITFFTSFVPVRFMSRNKLSKVWLSFTLSIFMLLFMANIVPVTANDYILRLNKSELILTVGEKDTLTVVEKRPEHMSIMWSSSNPEVAKVTYWGEVIAYSEGVAIITATNNYASFECKVTVKAQQQTVVLESLRLNPSSVQLNIGDTIAPNAVITPSTIHSTDIVWNSSNPGVATVQNGVIRAVSGGTAVITASLMGKSASCTVEVAGAATGITLNKSELVLRPMAHETLIAEVKPANAVDKTITWTTTNPQVAIVDQGAVLAMSDGVAIITARAGNYTADCRVKVQTEVEWVSLAFNRIDIQVGESAMLYANVLPQGAISSGFTWSSNDPSIATVDSNGRVTALKEGMTFIYVESDGKMCNNPAIITVTEKKEEEKKEEKIVINNGEIYPGGILITHNREIKQRETLSDLQKGEVFNLYVVPLPIKANQLDGFKPIRWESSNPAVATVDSSGTVKLLSGGTVTITAQTANNRFKDSIYLRVGEPILPTAVDQLLNKKLNNLIYNLTKGDLWGFKKEEPIFGSGVRG